MQGYVAVQDGAFAESRECFRELEGWLASEDAAGLQLLAQSGRIFARLQLPSHELCPHIRSPLDHPGRLAQRP